MYWNFELNCVWILFPLPFCSAFWMNDDQFSVKKQILDHECYIYLILLIVKKQSVSYLSVKQIVKQLKRHSKSRDRHVGKKNIWLKLNSHVSHHRYLSHILILINNFWNTWNVHHYQTLMMMLRSFFFSLNWFICYIAFLSLVHWNDYSLDLVQLWVDRNCAWVCLYIN